MNTFLTRAFGAAFFTVAVTEFTQIGALLIDGIITSKYLGASDIAAVGVASPFYFLVGIIGTGVAVGLQTVCTKEMGSGNTTSIADFVDVPAVGIAGAEGLLAGIGYGEVNGEDVENVGIIALRSIAASSALITVLLLVFAKPIAVFYLGEDSRSLPLMVFAIGTIAVGTFFSELTYTLISYLQAIENTRYAQIMEINTNLVSLLICAFLLSFPFGIYGIFSAYPISQLIILLAYIFRYVIKTKKIPPTRKDYLDLDPLFYKGPGDEIAYPIETLEHCALASEQVYLFCKGHGLDERKSLHASLCIEEVTTNIIEHGFARKSGANRAEIRVTLNNDSLIIRVRDNGREFDLSKLANILTDESAPYSNIGIKLICRSAKDIHYYRIWGMNTTILEI